jgi:hypothetical protein
LPPHFQIKSTAKEANQQLSIDFFSHCKNVYGRFGFPERKKLDCTFGMNEKGGMNAVELDKYINSAIVPLYPDMEDVPGKRVIIKVDSGPGRTNLQMLSEAKLKGLYIYPSVPNTTSVTQEADELYGPFKTIYRINLQLLTEIRYQQRKPVQITDLPILVFGQPPSWVSFPDGRRFRDAFTETFSPERCLRAWSKCGAVPLTRAPLKSPKVRHEVIVNREDGTINEDADPETSLLLAIEHRNKMACEHLSAIGFDGSQLLIKAPRKKAPKQLTAPLSKERVLALKEAKSAGQLFIATGGSHINSTDYFRARELADREQKVKVLKKKKKELMANTAVRKAAEALIVAKGGFTQATAKDWTVKDLKVMLRWKTGKNVNGTRSELLDMYSKQKKVPLSQPEWTQRDEDELQSLKQPLMPLGETAIGVKSRQMANAVSNSVQYLSPNTKAKLRAALEDEEEEVGDNII